MRQMTSDGELWPSLHRFPSVPRALAQALTSERWPGVGRARRAGLDPNAYAREGRFDWTTGAVLAVRREAFEAVGGFDERFFLFSEETDLCKRIQDAGWEAHFEPQISFVHHAGKAGVDPAREAQMAYAPAVRPSEALHAGGGRHLPRRADAHHLLRSGRLRFGGATGSAKAEASARALSVMLGKSAPPFQRREAGATDTVQSARPMRPCRSDLERAAAHMRIWKRPGEQFQLRRICG